MSQRFTNAAIAVLFSSFLFSSLMHGLAVAGPSAKQSRAADPDADFDRLDGTGLSGKKVHVIEWEGNLEVHVYPAGSLKGLALKLDKKNKNKPVMVIGYRFDNDPKKQLIRRAILGIDLRESFKVYRDPSTDEYDKIIISNNSLSSQVVAFKLDPEPTELYPEGHPNRLIASDEADGKPSEKRRPAQESGDSQGNDSGFDEESGTIRPFMMDRYNSY